MYNCFFTEYGTLKLYSLNDVVLNKDSIIRIGHNRRFAHFDNNAWHGATREITDALYGPIPEYIYTLAFNTGGKIKHIKTDNLKTAVLNRHWILGISKKDDSGFTFNNEGNFRNNEIYKEYRETLESRDTWQVSQSDNQDCQEVPGLSPREQAIDRTRERQIATSSPYREYLRPEDIPF